MIFVDAPRIFVNGKWEATPNAAVVRNPYSGTVVGNVGYASADQVSRGIAGAKAYRTTLTGYAMSQILSRTAEKVADTADAFAKSIVDESGICLKDARREVSRAVTTLEIAGEEAKRLLGEAIPTDVTATASKNLAMTKRVPIGVVCAITPFNRPLNQVVTKLAPALAARNTVILKPSEKTPLTALRFIDTLLESGLPAEMITVLTGRPEDVGEKLVRADEIDMLTFTGSTKVGQRIGQLIGMKRTAFELGDSGALVVLDDADLDQAAAAAVTGAFATSGQSCRGVKRIIVMEQVADRFVEKLKDATAKLVVGDPSDEKTDVGTLISEQAAGEVERRVTEALMDGARLVAGHRRQGAQYWPTIVDHVAGGMALVKEETFGPCAPVIRVAGYDEAIAEVNSSEFGLQTGLFTNSLSHAKAAFDALEVGTLILNAGPQYDAPNIPFGGVKKSGIGREGVRFAMQEMSIIRTLVV